MAANIALDNKNFFDLNPIVFGYEKCLPNHKFGPFIREFYLVHYVVDGMGNFQTDHKTYHLKKGDIFIIKPGEITVYQADSAHPWHYIWIGFNGALSKRLDSLESPVKSLSSRVFYEMLECENIENTKEEFLASKLFLLFSVLFRNEKNLNNHVKKAVDYINTNYMKELYVHEIAEILNIDRGYLFRIFKHKMGISVQQYILLVRMEKAVYFLKQNFSVSQTANMVGYNDVFNFSKMFKKTYGMSPKYYSSSF